jgi:hypothetical protein
MTNKIIRNVPLDQPNDRTHRRQIAEAVNRLISALSGLLSGGNNDDVLTYDSSSDSYTKWSAGGGGGTVDVVSNVAQDRILGRVTAGSGDSEELTAAQVRTLINVEDGATADQSAAEILTAIKTVDGAASGLDADLLDGNEATAFATAAQGALADSALQSETSHADVVVDGDFTSNGILTRTSAGVYAILADASANWNTAYGWGDHSAAGYITATLSQEQVEDYAGALIATGGTKTLITVTYQDATGDMDFVVDNNLANYDNTTSAFITAASLHDAVTVTDSAEIDFTLTGQNITASLIAASIDETKLDVSVNASLDLADSSVQPSDNISTLTNDSGFISDITGEALSTLSDVTITTIATGEVLKWNGTAWINNTLAELGVDPAGTDNSTDVTLAGTGTYLSLAGQQITVDPITESDISDLQAYLTSETSHADVVVDGDFASNGILKRTAAGVYGIVTDNSANWDTAYGWGDHSTQGYLTADLSQEQVEDYAGALIATGGTKTLITVTYQDVTNDIDFVVDSDLANYNNTNSAFITAASLHDAVTVADSAEIDFTLTGQQITASLITGSIDVLKLDSGVQTSLGLADSALQSETSHADVLVDGDFSTNGLMSRTGAGTYSIVADASSNWNTAFGWGNHASAGYITDITGEALSTLSDVTITTIADGEVLRWNGAAWINNTLAELGVDPAGTDNSTDVTLSGTGTYLSLVGQAITVDPITESDISDLGSYITASSTDTLTNKTFDANGTGNSLSNVDVADLANGTDGELITWSAAGAPTTVAVGTSGHVLTSNGTGAAPTFQAGGGGDCVLITSGTASSVSSVDLMLDNATYQNYMLVVDKFIPTTDNVAGGIRTSTNGGSTFDSGGSSYKWGYYENSMSSTQTPADFGGNASLIYTIPSTGTATNEAASFIVYIQNPADSAYTRVNFHGQYTRDDGQHRYYFGGGLRNSAANVDAIQIIPASSTIESISYSLYGYT